MPQNTLQFVLKIVVLVVVVSGAFLVLVASVPSNTMEPHYKVKKIINSLLPEGWSFFTRSPREDNADIYLIRNGRMIKLSAANGAPGNYFGLSRLSRKTGMELSLLANQIPDSAWKSTYNLYEVNDLKVHRITNTENIDLLEKGTYVIATYPPVPWSYARYPDHYKTKYKLAKIEI